MKNITSQNIYDQNLNIYFNIYAITLLLKNIHIKFRDFYLELFKIQIASYLCVFFFTYTNNIPQTNHNELLNRVKARLIKNITWTPYDISSVFDEPDPSLHFEIDGENSSMKSTIFEGNQIK